MKVKNSKIIQFNLSEQSAKLQISPKRLITITAKTIFAQNKSIGHSGYMLIEKHEHGDTCDYLSERVITFIAKYFEFINRDKDYDYYRIPFEKLTIQ